MTEHHQRICLIHYHEIGLKGHNRGKFENRLLKNVEPLLEGFPIVTMRRISGRICVYIKEGTDYETAVRISEIIKNVPGVARVSCGFKCERILDTMGQVAVSALSEVGQFQTFKVQARRNHTDFDVHSMDMNRIIGAVLCDAFPDKQVKMKNPDVTVGVEVVENAVYIYARSVRGIGGLPVGSSGKVVSLLSGGIDSPVALWKIARRGAICIGVHFSGRPQTSDASEFLVNDIAHVLEQTGCVARVYMVPFGNYQREIALKVPPRLRIVMYRRLMFRVAQEIAKRENAGALVTGESLGQVASQTLDNIRCTDAVCAMPVFRPLIGTDKLEIIEEAQRLGTFELSSQDAPDCCTLFMPRNPETHANLTDVLDAEQDLPIDEWVMEMADAAEPHDYACPSYHPAKTAPKAVETDTDPLQGSLAKL